MAYYVEMASRCTRTRSDEYMVTMRVCRQSDGEPARELAGRYVTERFGRKRIWRGMLLDRALRTSPQSIVDSHGGSAQSVLRQLWWGTPGRFKVRPDATFVDYHGGNGLRVHNGGTAWFTDEALRRGIGWTFVQSYRSERVRIGMFHVTRIFRAPAANRMYTIEVMKRPC